MSSPGQDTPRPSLNLTLVGCGRMGSALLQIWLDDVPGVKISVLEPSDLPPSLEKAVTHGRVPEDLRENLKAADVIVLAVKPQAMKNVCENLKPYIDSNTLILSIAAGQSLATFENYFGKNQPIIRAIPNTPAAIGKGMNVAVANPHVSAAQKTTASDILKAAGLLEWVEDENLLNAVTALSGSGPAYVFYLMEVLTHAGEKAGLGKSLAETLARQTVIGSAALAETSHEDAAVLRKNVTSPGGTTEAALNILMSGEVQKIFDDAIHAAKRRGEELSA